MNNFNIILILFVIIFTYLILNKKNVNEYFYDTNSKINIAFIIPVTSNKRNYKDIQETDFLKILFPSFLKTINKTDKYIYNFYLGYDHDDKFFIENKDKIVNYVKSLNKQNINIKFISIYEKKGKLGEIWSILAKKAAENNNYIYQLGDDIKIIDSGWEDNFINKLTELKNIGVVGPNDVNNSRLLTQSFVHKKHLEIFTTYYPLEIENWYIDDWITQVYGERSIQLKNRVKNSGGEPRYKINRNKTIFHRELYNGRRKLETYLDNYK